MLGLETQNGKDDGARVDCGESVAQRDAIHIHDDILVGRVVATEPNDGAKCQAIRVKNLIRCRQPHLRGQ